MASCPIVVGTWSFSRQAVTIAASSLQNGLPSITALERGINAIEEDPRYGKCFVGCGGARNSDGHLQLDAAVMDGKFLDFGSVTALSGVTRPISVARKVMDVSPHSMLTDQGAHMFAIEQGMTNEMSEQHMPTSGAGGSHDTLGLIALDSAGNIAAGVSTSGMANKYPGRVGDSALPGSGLYADNEAGAACCSGDGDQILKFCPSYQAVHAMRQGVHPQAACENVIKQIHRRRGHGQMFEMAIIAVDMKGQYGAATSVEVYYDPLTDITYPGFPYSVWKPDMDRPDILIQSSFLPDTE